MQRLSEEGEQRRQKLEDLSTTAYSLLVAGQYDDALRMFTEGFEIDARPGWLNNIGLTKLCMDDYVGANIAFSSAFEASPHPGEFDYINLGLCEWCQDKTDSAVETWRSGIGCQYTDAAGGMSIPLLLYFAGAVLHDRALPELAQQTIASKMPRFGANWPAPLARYMMRTENYDDVHNRIATYSQALQERRFPLLKFYVGVTALERGDEDTYRRSMADIVKTLRSRNIAEWFLARHETRKRELLI